MGSVISLRLPDGIIKSLDKIAETMDRPRTYLIKKALENYLSEFADYQVALDRFLDKDDKIISSKELRQSLGI
jgi:predicted DNA-binding protein